MPRALNLLRPALHYRRESFDLGLRTAGFDVVDKLPNPKPGDVLLIWNRYSGHAEQAQHFELAGAMVLVAENGFLGKHWRRGDWFSLSLGNLGSFWSSGTERWDSWNVELQPFREDGDETIIFAQRGIGEPGFASPPHWAESTQRRIGGRIRAHPGNTTPRVALADDLRRARQCVTWNSAAGLHALMLGVPVWCAGPWVGAGAARPLREWGAEPKRDEASRLAMFRRLAWGMWTLDEIRSGLPIRRLTGGEFTA